jgi:hypothetical protein
VIWRHCSHRLPDRTPDKANGQHSCAQLHGHYGKVRAFIDVAGFVSGAIAALAGVASGRQEGSMTPVDLVSVVVAAAILFVMAIRVVRALASVVVPFGIAILVFLFVINRVNGGPDTAGAIDRVLHFLRDLYAHIVGLTQAT